MTKIISTSKKKKIKRPYTSNEVKRNSKNNNPNSRKNNYSNMKHVGITF